MWKCTFKIKIQIYLKTNTNIYCVCVTIKKKKKKWVDETGLLPGLPYNQQHWVGLHWVV